MLEAAESFAQNSPCGLEKEAMKVVSAIDGISFIYFDERDVVRHKLVQQIVKAYEAFTNGNGRS